MKASVYIIYSDSIDKFYVGFTTENVEVRIERHNKDYYDEKYTKIGKPWKLFFQIKCKCTTQAKQIENHIKSMKSKQYIANLAQYPEIANKLLAKYDDCKSWCR